MPAKSAPQYRLMQAVLHGASDKVPKAVAKEFVDKTPVSKRKQFSKGK